MHKSVRVQAHSPTLAIARAVLWACTCADLMHAVHSCNALVKMRIFTELEALAANIPRLLVAARPPQPQEQQWRE